MKPVGALITAQGKDADERAGPITRTQARLVVLAAFTPGTFARIDLHIAYRTMSGEC